ncbi:hypothetical protein Aau02nite_25120 [Amorphoplanes auranticolor]|uniref:PknH-like protein n=1 Tax=Actinoplanes auranticolor TaxID=47988 RepID=A0A919S8W1_9ACTN|nr:hypothetical protein Aau02nite_25120 [Actinoplanes auranticolor]
MTLFLVVGLTATATACTDPPPLPGPTAAGPTTDASASAPSSGPASMKPPGKSAVTAALLTPAELGAGYSTNPALAGNNPANGMNTSLLDCAEASSDASAVSAHQVYQGGAVGPFVVETITVTQTAQAAALMDRLRTVKKNCHQFDGEMAGGIKMQVTIDDLTVAKVGDDTVAYRLTATVPGAGAALYAHLVTARAGNLVVLLSLMQMTSPDVTVTEKMVEAAVTKARAELR